MSDFKFSCPSCGQHVVCDTSNAGMQVLCPSCQKPLTVPAAPPSAAPPAPAPGKLSINKAAHQHAAPPPQTAAKGPPRPPSGGAPQQRAPMGRPKKKSPMIPLAIGAGVLLVAAIAWFAIVSPMLQKQAEEKKRAEEAAAAQAAADAKAAAEAAKAKARANAKPVWKLDLADATIPERSAIGRHHGADFTMESALFQGSSLVLLQTANGSPHQFAISLPIKPGESILGQTFDVTPTDTTNLPHVMLSWKDAGSNVPGSKSFSKGYAMRLEFGENAKDGKIPGKIYLCLPDPEQSFVGGTFTAQAKNLPAQAKAASTAPKQQSRPKKR